MQQVLMGRITDRDGDSFFGEGLDVLNEGCEFVTVGGLGLFNYALGGGGARRLAARL